MSLPAAVTASIVAPNSHDAAADPWVLGGGVVTAAIAVLLVRHVLRRQHH